MLSLFVSFRRTTFDRQPQNNAFFPTRTRRKAIKFSRCNLCVLSGEKSYEARLINVLTIRRPPAFLCAPGIILYCRQRVKCNFLLLQEPRMSQERNPAAKSFDFAAGPCSDDLFVHFPIDCIRLRRSASFGSRWSAISKTFLASAVRPSRSNALIQ